MFVAHHPSELQPLPRAVTLGTFDGVHKAHQRLVARAAATGLRATVVTFDPHPRVVLGRPVDRICTLDRRLELLAAAGAQDVLVVEFTTALSRLTPEQWVRSMLLAIGTRRVIIGENYRFGHRRAGDAETLRRMGLSVELVPLLYGASSSAVRDLVQAGNLVGARRHLGRPFELEGVLGEADPTGSAPLVVEPTMLMPPSGVYEAVAIGRPTRASVRREVGAAHVHLARPPFGSTRVGDRVRVELLHPASTVVHLSDYHRPNVVHRHAAAVAGPDARVATS
jgi:FAD synthase